jgi:hypothetical protein
LRFLVQAAVRMPKVAIVALLLVLATLAGIMSYAGFLVVGVVANHLGTGRLMAGLLLGGLFARLPWVREGKLRTIGLLPKRARLPVMVALLAFCLLSYLYQGEVVPMLVLGFAMTFLLIYRRLRQVIVSRAMSSLFKMPPDPNLPKSTDNAVIDVEFREKKD